jgi:ADP-ribosylglycohydrolase
MSSPDAQSRVGVAAGAEVAPVGAGWVGRETYQSRVRGSLLGGAIGDALGGPVEYWSLAQILERCGPSGVRSYVPEDVGGKQVYGRITDDTQMTLFTVEGVIRASVRTDRGLGFTVGVVQHAYDRWLDTQQLPEPSGERDGWLQSERWLYSRRAPGLTCLDALHGHRDGHDRISQFGAAATNTSKGCGCVMRSAPFGLLPPWMSSNTPRARFDVAATAAGYTHGHPTGRLASGALAVLVGAVVAGDNLDSALDAALAELARHSGHDETTAALHTARRTAKDGPSFAAVESLGGGWVAEEALAISVYAALCHQGPSEVLDGLALAATHSGDSDSTSAICGNILGALHGDVALPAELVFEVEGRATILQLADDLVLEFCDGHRLHGDLGPYTSWTRRYPGW